MKSRYFIELAFNGKNYHGWQIQPNAVTVQEVIEKALTTLLNEKIETTGAGRTDAGVHAKHFVAHFDSADSGIENSNLVFHLNSFLPGDIYIKKIYSVPNNAHCRFNAISRTYEYCISTRKDPFYLDFAHYFFHPLDIGLMNESAAILSEYIDFTSFSKLHTDTQTNICKIFHARWTENDGLIVLNIKADRFLRNMVRAIVGTSLDVGTKKISTEDFRKIIESKDRCKAGQSVPPQGLFLMGIEYKPH
ncbi:MAG: tRNA pseudouridine(38-40) synthase TruA [Bacteroidia bacterium]|nr:tRNA pseudouridine(38-40) synthase TruA [Bacteroidia bacterium]